MRIEKLAVTSREALQTAIGIAGDAEAFLTVLRDTMELYCPELTAVSDYQYTASIVCEEGDTAQIRELRTKYNAFVSAIYMYRDSERVLVVSANVFSKQVTEHNVQKDWTFNGNGNASSTLEFFFQVPSLRNTLWGTDDAKQPSLGAFRFGNIWNVSILQFFPIFPLVQTQITALLRFHSRQQDQHPRNHHRIHQV